MGMSNAGPVVKRFGDVLVTKFPVCIIVVVASGIIVKLAELASPGGILSTRECDETEGFRAASGWGGGFSPFRGGVPDCRLSFPTGRRIGLRCLEPCGLGRDKRWRWWSFHPCGWFVA